MPDEKRFFWLKLKVNFMTSETVDFLMSQDGGANYIVLYQMLCLKTINTHGRLSRQIGEVIIPFDEAKIQRDCKWFSIDTIRVAMELYRKLGLIYEDSDGTLVISDHGNLIGSEGASAERMRKMRNGEKQRALPESTMLSQCDAQCDTMCDENVTTEIEYRDRDKEKEIDNKKYPPAFIEKDINNEGNIHDAVAEEKESVSVNVQAAAAENPKTSVCTLVGKAWNKTGFPKVRSFPVKSPRGEAISALSAQYGTETVLAAIEKAKQSEFLNELGDRVTLDWFLQPEHFQKIIEGQYDRKWERRGGEPKSGGDWLLEKIARGDFDE